MTRVGESGGAGDVGRYRGRHTEGGSGAEGGGDGRGGTKQVKRQKGYLETKYNREIS